MTREFKQILFVFGLVCLVISGMALAADPSYCNSPVQQTQTIQDGGAVAVPGTPLVGRRNITVCDSPENAGTPQVKCGLAPTLPDGGTANPDGGPVAGAGNPGDVLRVGDCIAYPVGSGTSLLCTSNQPGAAVTTLECR